MKKGMEKFLKCCFAIVAFGIGAANIVNGTMIMYDMYRDDHPRDFVARFIGREEDFESIPEMQSNEDNT